MHPGAKVYVAGHRGLAGSAMVRRLERAGYKHLLTRTHAELDLTDDAAVGAFFDRERPEYVLLAAAKVGGIAANASAPATFLMENLRIQASVLRQAQRTGVKRLLFLGSSCIYPRDCPQPIREEYLLTGPLEATNRAYAIAKIAGVEACWAYNRECGTRFVAAMPTNLYGARDNYDLESSHVLPALIRKIHTAKTRGDRKILLWGTGTPQREFLYSDDMADACVFLMELPGERYDALTSQADVPPLINVGYGKDVTIRELAETIMDVIGFRGEIAFDPSRPDGTPRKLLDVSRLAALGWTAKTSLREGIAATYRSFVEEHPELSDERAAVRASS